MTEQLAAEALEAAPKPWNAKAVGTAGAVSGLALLGFIWYFGDRYFDAEELRRQTEREDRQIHLTQLNAGLSSLATESREMNKSLTQINARLVASENVAVQARRELEIRVERLEEWQKTMPDGVGLRRWTIDHEVEMTLRTERVIGKKLPDPREIAK